MTNVVDGVARLYVRVSSTQQAERGLSLDAQEKLLRDSVPPEFEQVELYVDRGLSGGRVDRPELVRLLRELSPGDLVAVASLDRLGRSLKHLCESLQVINDGGGTFVSVKETIDTTTAAGRLFFHLLAAIAEFERSLIGERIKATAEERVRRDGGRPWGSKYATYGYDWQPRRLDDSGQQLDQRVGLVVNRVEAAVVRRVFREFLDGKTIAGICRDLNADGLLTKTGKPWEHGTMSRLMRSCQLAGKIKTPRGHIIDGNHEAVVDDDVWARAQAILSVRSGGRRTRSPEQPYLLHGLLRCQCGEPMLIQSSGTRGEDGSYSSKQYICRANRRQGRGTCPMPNLPAKLIDSTVWIYFERQVLDLDATKEQVKHALDGRRTDVLAMQWAAKRQMMKVDEHIAKLEGDYFDGRLAPEVYQSLLARKQDEAQAARSQDQQFSSRLREVDAELTELDVEAGVLGFLADLRRSLVEDMQSAGVKGVAAVRNTLATIFEEFVVIDLESRSQVVLSDFSLAEGSPPARPGDTVSTVMKLLETGKGSLVLHPVPRRDLAIPVDVRVEGDTYVLYEAARTGAIPVGAIPASTQ